MGVVCWLDCRGGLRVWMKPALFAAPGMVKLRSSGAAADGEYKDVAGSSDPQAFHERDGGALIRADIANLDARPEALWCCSGIAAEGPQECSDGKGKMGERGDSKMGWSAMVEGGFWECLERLVPRWGKRRWVSRIYCCVPQVLGLGIMPFRVLERPPQRRTRAV